MLSSMLSVSRRPARVAVRLLAALAVAAMAHEGALAATLPTAPKTFDTTYAAPGGATLTVAAGGNLQSALDQAQLGDTIVLEAGATFTGPFTLPNKTTGSGWIYVVSSKLASLPAAGKRVSPSDAVNMPKIVAKPNESAIVTVTNSHHFRFVGIEFAPEPGAPLYTLIVIDNQDTSPATLAHHIVFDRCYVHGYPNVNDKRGIDMDGAYVAVVDSYITDFQAAGVDSQALWAFNTTGPLQIRNNYIEAASENVMTGGANSLAATLVPADIEISNNYFFKPLSLIAEHYVMKNLLEFKNAQRVLVNGNTFVNSPLQGQVGFGILVTPRNSGREPWAVTRDIEFSGNMLINVGSGFNIVGQENPYPTAPTERLLIRNNFLLITGLNGADGRGFQITNGGSDYTIDHNTIIYSPVVSTSDLIMSQTAAWTSKVRNFVFTNNLSTRSAYGVLGTGVGQGSRALNANFTDWTFSKNVIVDAPAGEYPAGNFFPNGVTAVRFANYTGGNYTLAGDSPYKNAGTDGTDIGVNGALATTVLPNPPTNVAVK
jgi:Right handed beta helix region